MTVAATLNTSAPASTARVANSNSFLLPGTARKSWNDATTRTPPAFARATVAASERNERTSTSTPAATGKNRSYSRRRDGASSPGAAPPSAGWRTVTSKGLGARAVKPSSRPGRRTKLSTRNSSTSGPPGPGPSAHAAASESADQTVPTTNDPRFGKVGVLALCRERFTLYDQIILRLPP